MGATRKAPSRRARRVLSGVLAGLIAVGGGTALILGGGQAANAALFDVTNDIPEFTPITHSPFLFQGTADPFEVITVKSGGFGPDCIANADAGGDWSCNIIFTASTDATVVTASRPDDGNPATQDSEGWEYPVALPVTINETQPGQVLTNNLAAPVTGSGAWPTANMIVLINGSPCIGGPADAGGNWSCTPPALGPGTYVLSASQDVGGATSDVTNSSFIYDNSTFIPSFDFPYDSTLAPAGVATSDSTPLVGGGAGDAEPFGTVQVYASDFGLAPPAHPNGGPGNLWCVAAADAAGAWSCSGPALSVNHYWDFGATQTDLAGNSTGSPDDEFDIHILPPPAAPTVFTPTNGFGEISPFTAFGSVDAVTTEVRISEGGTDLCGPIAPVANNFTANGGTCVGGVPLAAGGPHSLDFTAYDVYGTGTTTTVTGLDSWAPPTIVTPALGSNTSASTVHVTGYAPIGSDLQVRLNGNPICNIIPVTPSYDCVTPLLAVPFGHALEVDYTDPWGDPSGTVNGGFNTVPTLPAPVFTAPNIGYQSSNRVVHVAMTNTPEGTIYVREGATDLCTPTPIAVAVFSCNTVPLSVGQHTITISQTDQYGVFSASAQRIITILPTPNQPLTMKVFGFSITVMNPDGSPLDPAGLGTGDPVTVVATGVPPGTRLLTEIHSTPIQLGTETVGQNGIMRLTTVVPVVPPGPHEIVVTATGPGYFPAAFSQPVAVHGLKVITNAQVVKELGEPDETKELGTPTEAGPASTGAGGGAAGPGAHGFEDPTVFGSSVVSPYDAPAHAFALSPAGIVLSGSIALAFLLLVGLPAELLESTIRSNYDRAFGWLGRLRRRVGRMLAPVARALANPWVGSSLTILAAAILLGFADPDFGFNGASVRLVIAMVLAVVAINIGISLIVMRVARRAFDVSALLKPMPAALAIVGISVLVSRLAGISPGFLFGIVLGIAYARELKLRDEARLGVLGVGLTIAAGLIAWLGYGLASAIASGPGFANNLIIETLAAITLEALGTLVIALLPIEFLDGRTIFRWSKLAWLGLYALTAVVFLFVVVPLSDNWGTMSAPVFGWGTLFAVFAAVAIVTWAIFRRVNRVRPSTPEAAAPPQRSRR